MGLLSTTMMLISDQPDDLPKISPDPLRLDPFKMRGLRWPPATIVESYSESDCSGSRLVDDFDDTRERDLHLLDCMIGVTRPIGTETSMEPSVEI